MYLWKLKDFKFEFERVHAGKIVLHYFILSMEPIVRKLINKAEVTESELNIIQLKLEQIEEKFNKEENTDVKITTLLTSLQQLKSVHEHLKEEIKSSREQHESVLATLNKNHSHMKECFENFTHTLSKAPM